jgi:hypothetical protein
MSTIRFYGRTSADTTTTLHFKTSSPELVTYFTSYAAPSATFAQRNKTLIETAMPLVGHEANLPGGLKALGVQANNEMAMTYGLFTDINRRGWRIRDPAAGGPFWSVDDAAKTNYSTLHQVWVRPSGAPEPPIVDPASTEGSCLDHKAADSSAASGVYLLNISSQSVRAYCDMEHTTGAGVGWMLVLNYVRGSGVVPVLQRRNAASGFPLLRSTRLGSDESWMRGDRSPWGHVDLASLTTARAALRPRRFAPEHGPSQAGRRPLPRSVAAHVARAHTPAAPAPAHALPLVPPAGRLPRGALLQQVFEGRYQGASLQHLGALAGELPEDGRWLRHPRAAQVAGGGAAG